MIPTNRDLIRSRPSRRDLPHRAEKWKAVVEEIIGECAGARPAGAGRYGLDREVREAGRMLRKRGHQARRAQRQVPRDGSRDRGPGRALGAVTIATNMAGRGTDILLGGNPEFLARQDLLAEAGSSPARPGQGDWDAAYAEALEKRDAQSAREENEQVIERLGGLHIIGTERHESRRIDNQLRGRAGRQGDPGIVALLPVARRRPDAHLRRRQDEGGDEEAGDGRGRPDRVPDGQPGDRARAEAGRAAQLRDPQTPARVRRRQQQAAQRDLRAAPRLLEGKEQKEFRLEKAARSSTTWSPTPGVPSDPADWDLEPSATAAQALLRIDPSGDRRSTCAQMALDEIAERCGSRWSSATRPRRTRSAPR